MIKWFKSTIGKKSIVDKFRIKTIVLNSGLKKYYPQFKNSDYSSEWLCLIVTRDGNVIPIDVSNHNLINSDYYCELSEDGARITINTFKAQLVTERSKEYFDDEIIQID